MSTYQEELVDRYLLRILEVNQTINLTRITDIKSARMLHIEDSLSVLDEMNVSPAGLYGDLGSGGGFPGVPLGIYSERKTMLIDSVKKKMSAVQGIINELALDDEISTYAGRIEELSQEYRGKFSVLTARALSSLPSLIELASPLLVDSGHLICLKSQADEEEISQAKELEELVGMKLIKERDFYLSDGETYRRIFVFEKSSEPEIILPRRIGMAQKKPLQKK